MRILLVISVHDTGSPYYHWQLTNHGTAVTTNPTWVEIRQYGGHVTGQDTVSEESQDTQAKWAIPGFCVQIQDYPEFFDMISLRSLLDLEHPCR